VDRLLSRRLFGFVGPSVDDGISVEVIEVSQDPGLEFGFRRDADVAEHGSRHFGEKAFDEVEPRAVELPPIFLDTDLSDRRQMW
jgi:hypothetical protein